MFSTARRGTWAIHVKARAAPNQTRAWNTHPFACWARRPRSFRRPKRLAVGMASWTLLRGQPDDAEKAMRHAHRKALASPWLPPTALGTRRQRHLIQNTAT